MLNLKSKRVELQRDSLTTEEANTLFQSAYKEIIGPKRDCNHGHGYMSKYPSRARLVEARLEQARATAAEKERNKQLEGEVDMLKEKVAQQDEETERKVEEAKLKIQQEEAIKREELRREMMEQMAQMIAAERQALTQQVIHMRLV